MNYQFLLAASAKNLNKEIEDNTDKTSENKEEQSTDEKMEESTPPTVLSEKRKALFEPLEPIMDLNGRRPPAESLLPPPDFDSASYPRGWLIGKKRKLVNVDVVESMRRIAVQEMNRKVLFICTCSLYISRGGKMGRFGYGSNGVKVRIGHFYYLSKWAGQVDL